MILPELFTVTEKNDYEEIASASGRHRALLDAFASSNLPVDYSAEKLIKYADSLLETQKADGSFSVYAGKSSLDSDSYTDACIFVTLCAAAFLNLLLERFNERKYAAPLDRVLNSPVIKDLDFADSGSAAVVQQCEAVFILASGGLISKLAFEGVKAPALSAKLKKMKTELNGRIKNNNTTLDGGIDYSGILKNAASLLKVL